MSGEASYFQFPRDTVTVQEMKEKCMSLLKESDTDAEDFVLKVRGVWSHS